MLELREVLMEIKKRKKLEHDKDYAKWLGIDAPKFSRLIRTYEHDKSWRWFLRLMRACEELGIDVYASSARGLPGKPIEEDLIDGSELLGETTRKDATDQKMSTQEKHARSVPARRNKKR